MNNWFQANNHQLSLEIVKFKKVDYMRCHGCLHEELGMLFHMCCGEFRIIMVQIHLKANDYSLALHLSKLPKLPYIVVVSLALNLRIFS